ncbi:MAG: CDP-diacylglycerol--glycerol-3-phosphate 3-phosphatidyltransferase [Parachlamydiaceae bacterium]|nr:CDP-diacylglycerol--glycerol-3-phosphate 3-phosphatidyltransferase [Parachlamydiaceae bacterium]
MSFANYLTFFRIFISPIFLLIYLEYETFNISLVSLPYVLLFLLGISELSDALDGYFARKFNEVTAFGKLLDPMADSIYRISIFLTFTLHPIKLPMILIFIFIYRDSVISMLRTVCALKGFALAARPSGKLKAIVQAFAALLIILLLIPYTMGLLSLESLQSTSMIIVSIAAIYTVVSGIDYLIANRHYISKALITKQVSAEG